MLMVPQGFQNFQTDVLREERDLRAHAWRNAGDFDSHHRGKALHCRNGGPGAEPDKVQMGKMQELSSDPFEFQSRRGTPMARTVNLFPVPPIAFVLWMLAWQSLASADTTWLEAEWFQSARPYPHEGASGGTIVITHDAAAPAACEVDVTANQEHRQYEQRLSRWKLAVAEAEARGEKPPAGFNPPFGPGHFQAPYGLYHAMIAPLIPYPIRGVIWYQGESNTAQASLYRKLLPALIRNWRDDWGQGDFSFLIVQLPNCGGAVAKPAESTWARLREAQLMALALPETGMAVTIDIGEADNLHPHNKQGVGRRLALWALARNYGQPMTYSGPIYRSKRIEGSRIRLFFDHVGRGLHHQPVADRPSFAVAARDRKFKWAQVKKEGDTLVVWNEGVLDPVAVRYAWADNPHCALYNREGLPASPFRTDDWLND